MHISYEAGVLEDPMGAKPADDIFLLTDRAPTRS